MGERADVTDTLHLKLVSVMYVCAGYRITYRQTDRQRERETQRERERERERRREREEEREEECEVKERGMLLTANQAWAAVRQCCCC